MEVGEHGSMRRVRMLLGGAAVVFTTAAIAAWLIVPLRVHLEMPAEAYKSWFDRQIVRTGFTIRGRAPPCVIAGEGHWDGTVEDLADHRPWEQCLRFTEAQRWSGVWDHGWEWSNFCAGSTEHCLVDKKSLDAAKPGTWLTFAENASPGDDLPDGIHRVEFVGRRTKYPGHFGHMGMYEHEMVVDRVISIQTIPGEKYTKRF
jgi:hypothetical protein